MEEQTKTVYERLLEANVEMDNYQSDLYVLATPEVMAILREAQKEDRSVMFSTFDDLRTGKRLVELPFQYQPYWESARSKRIKNLDAPAA